MRHKNKVKKLGKDAKHRKSILRNLTLSILNKERIKTTKTKAKIFRSFIEKIIHRAKIDSLHNRRIVYKDVRNTKLLLKLFQDIAKRYLDRNGGYTRIIALGLRKGDASEMCYIELVEQTLNHKQKANENEQTVEKNNKSTETNTEKKDKNFDKK